MSKPNASKVISGDSAVIARRYAHALYLLSSEQKQLETVASDLLTLKGLLKDNDDFWHLASHPRLTRGKAEEAMRMVAKTVEVGAIATDFIALMARNRRLTNLDNTIDAFLADLAKRRGESPVEVTVARSLTDAQKVQLNSQLAKLIGGKVNVVFTEDAALLGGMTVKIGSRLLDASVKGKLARLERQLKIQREAA